jgi:hypothetical protein
LVIVNELSRSRGPGPGGFSQANFPKETFEKFFGAVARGAPIKIDLFRVGVRGEIARDPARVSVTANVSGNYRFELNGAKWYAYPSVEEGRPILFVARIAPGKFLYRLLMPTDAEYPVANELLTADCGPYVPREGGRVRAIEMESEALRERWPTAPLWRVDPAEITAIIAQP